MISKMPHFIKMGPDDERSSEQSLQGAMNKFVSAVEHMDDTVMIPSRLRDMSASEKVTSNNGGNKRALLPVPKNGHFEDLFSFYTMLNAVKSELVDGPRHEDAPLPADPAEAEIARLTAAQFRHHLTGLFEVLSQLTDTADFLKSRYQEDIGELSPPLLSTPFLFN